MKYYIEGKEVRLIDLCKANEIKLVNEFETMADILLEENAMWNIGKEVNGCKLQVKKEETDLDFSI